jgi:hypothetical protein
MSTLEGLGLFLFPIASDQHEKMEPCPKKYRPRLTICELVVTYNH